MFLPTLFFFRPQVAADSEISLLTRGSTLSKATRKTWSSEPAEEEEEEEQEGEQSSVKFLPPEGGIPSPQLRCFESESTYEVAAESRPSDATEAQLNLSLDVTHTSVRSTDTTLEYYDAPLSQEQEEDEGVVTLNIKHLAEKGEPEENPSQTSEQTSLLATGDLEQEEGGEEEVKEDETSEDVMETGLEQEAKNEEEVQSEKEDKDDVESSDKQEEPSPLDQEETSLHNQGNSFAVVVCSLFFYNIFLEVCFPTPVFHSTKHLLCSDIMKYYLTHFVCELVCNQIIESTEVEPQDQPATATTPDVQSEATEFTEHLKLSEATESMYDLEKELEQSTGLS